MKKIMKVAICLTVAVLSFTACKKSDNITNNSNTLSLTLSAQGIPTDTNFSGILMTMSSPVYGSGVFGYATFNTSPTAFSIDSYVFAGGDCSVDSVMINDILLQGTVSGVFTNPVSGLSTLPPAKWVVKGGTYPIPSFTYTNTTPLPTYTGTLSFSTISRANNLTISAANFSGYDMVRVDVISASGSSQYVTAKSGSNVIFPSTLLEQLPADSGYVSVSLYKYNGQTVNGKNFLFITGVSVPQSRVTLQ